MTETPPKELRFKASDSILGYIRRFSSTEKAIFGAFVIVAIVTVAIMAAKLNSYFMTQIPGYGGELREGEVGLPRTINPILAITDADRDIASLTYSGLMKWNDGKLVPDIAKSIAISQDGLTYDFKLRDAVSFQDGTPLTADDVAFTIQKIQDPVLKSPRRADWANVTVTVVSPKEIRFALRQAYSPFLANTTIGILPQHIWSSVNDDQFIFSQYNTDPIGSGPYKVSSVSHDSGGIPTVYRLSTWGGYYGHEPYISDVSFTFFADSDKALSALDSGEIDSLSAVSSSDAARLASDTAQPYRVMETALPRVFGVFFNQSQAPVLADKTVRQALDMSVDRTNIVQKVLSGYGEPTQGPLPADMVPAKVANPRADIAGAQALLEKNGWKKDPSTGVYAKKNSKNAMQTLSFDIYTSDTPDLKETAELVRKSWNDLGAQVDVKVFNSSDLYQNVIRTRKYDALLFGELIGKDRDAFAFWDSSQRSAPGLNVALYANSKVDALLDDIRGTSNEAARSAKYADLDRLIRADIPAVFLYSPDFIYVVPKALRGIKLQGITVTSDRFNSISSWYVTLESVWKIFTK